jgi:predicted Zn-dependent peptidase
MLGIARCLFGENTMNVLRTIDEIEQLVENGKGWMGKRVVSEEEFFTLIQRLRSALPRELKDAEDLLRAGLPPSVSLEPSRPVQEIIKETSALNRQEQLQIIAALAARLEAAEGNL